MVLDASGVIAVLLAEPVAGWVRAQMMASGTRLRMAWVNAAEVAMTMERNAPGGGSVAMNMLEQLGVEFLPPDRDVAILVAEARQEFPLNFGDCFAYAHARLVGEPLLTLDADFLKTDLPNVLHPSRQ